MPPLNPESFEERLCLVCSKAFSYRIQKNRHGGVGKYCSIQCWGVAKRIRYERTCGWCGTPFDIAPRLLKKGLGKYCSQPCASRGNAWWPTQKEYVAWFWAQIQPAAHGCLEWQWRRHYSGYGTLIYQNRVILAHREAWELTFGLLLPAIDVLHHCDNPPCCNTKHLFLGTQFDNNRDKTLKGRNTRKLTREEIIAIRMLSQQGILMGDLATQFHVSIGHICNIVNRRTWKHLA